MKWQVPSYYCFFHLLHLANIAIFSLPNHSICFLSLQSSHFMSNILNSIAPVFVHQHCLMTPLPQILWIASFNFVSCPITSFYHTWHFSITPLTEYNLPITTIIWLYLLHSAINHPSYWHSWHASYQEAEGCSSPVSWNDYPFHTFHTLHTRRRRCCCWWQIKWHQQKIILFECPVTH